MILQAFAAVTLLAMCVLAADFLLVALGPRDWEATAPSFCTRCGKP